jgi:hypothetical protein
MAERSLILPFRGTDLNGLTNRYTICEYNLGLWDGTSTLKDMKGGGGENWCAYANDMSNAWWNKANSTHNGFTVAPDGSRTASIMNEAAANLEHSIARNFGANLLAGNYTFSVYAKAAGRNWLRLEFWKSGTDRSAWFNLSTGAVGTLMNCKAQCTPVGDGWYRCSISGDLSDPTGTWYIFYTAALANEGSAYQGTSIDALYLWGAQFERNDGYNLAASKLLVTGANAGVRQDLAKGGGLTLEASPFVTPLGRQLYSARAHANADFFSKAHDPIFDFGLLDHTIVCVAKQNVILNHNEIYHYVSSSSGWALNMRDNNSVWMVYQDASLVYAMSQPNATAPNTWAIIHATKKNGIATVYVNGIPGVPVDCSGKGVPGSANFGLLSSTVSDGNNMLYARIDSGFAMEGEAIRNEYAQIAGTAGILPNNKKIAYSFGRALAAYKASPDGATNLVPSGVPRVGSGGKWKNLATRSQEFGNAVWTKAGMTVSSDTYVAPDGTTTADTFHEDASNSNHEADQSYFPLRLGQMVTFSCYIKPINRSWVRLRTAKLGIAGYSAFFNVSTGAVGAVDNALASITAAGNGWYRCVLAGAARADGNHTLSIILASAYDTDLAQGLNQDSLIVWGAQFEEGDLSSHAPTAAKTVRSSVCDGDFNGLLIESARTNLINYSQNFTGSGWGLTRASVPSTSVVLPDGSTGTVNTLRDLADAGDPTGHYIQMSNSGALTLVNSTYYTYSVYMKAVNRTWAQMWIHDGTSAYAAYVNTATGAIGGIVGANASAKAEACGNGWFRFMMTILTTNTAGIIAIFCASADGNNTISGAGTDAYYLFGAQVEQGSHATSYIPTTSAAVARPKDQMTILPYKLNKMLQGQIGASPKLVCGFDQDASGSTMYSTTNYLYASTNFANASYWSPIASSIETDKLTAPDGTVSADFLKEDGASAIHCVYHTTVTVSNATAYCFSVYLKPVSRSWAQVNIGDIGGCSVYFDLLNKRVGSNTGAAFGGAGIEDAGNGWCRCWVWGTTTTTTATPTIVTAASDGGATYQGLNNSSIAMWGAQFEKGNKPTFFGFTGNAFTLGRYTLTKVGQPQPRYTEQEGFFHELNGTTDYWEIINGSGGSDFNFTGSFSIVGSITPLRIPVGSEEFHLVNKTNGGSDGYTVYLHEDDLHFFVCDGTGTTSIAIYGCAVAGHPLRFQATFEDMGGATNNKMRLYVNGFTAATSDVARKPAASTVDFGIGAYATGSGRFCGRMHELEVYNAYVATQAEHNAAYAAWKVDGILPTVISISSLKKKLRVTFDLKAGYTGSVAEVGGNPLIWLDIRGFVGTAGAYVNHLQALIMPNGLIDFSLYDSVGSVTEAYTGTGQIVETWRTYSFLIDLYNKANTAMTIDGSSSGITYTGNSGNGIFNLKDTMITIGDPEYNNSLDGSIRNVQLSAEE